MGQKEISATHLQFANDTIVFAEAEWMEVTTIKRILRCFEVLSRLKINFHKSHVCEAGVPKALVDDFATRLNCKRQSLPFPYLGLPFGANPRRKSTKIPVLNKFKSKLASSFFWG
mgnify:CR=1 FL=1